MTDIVHSAANPVKVPYNLVQIPDVVLDVVGIAWIRGSGGRARERERERERVVLSEPIGVDALVGLVYFVVGVVGLACGMTYRARRAQRA